MSITKHIMHNVHCIHVCKTNLRVLNRVYSWYVPFTHATVYQQVIVVKRVGYKSTCLM